MKIKIETFEYTTTLGVDDKYDEKYKKYLIEFAQKLKEFSKTNNVKQR